MPGCGRSTRHPCAIPAGLAILFDGGTAAAPRRLSWRFGHFSRSRTGILDASVLRYQADAEGRVPFLDRVERDHDEAALKRGFVASGVSGFVVDRVLRRERRQPPAKKERPDGIGTDAASS